MLCQPFVYRLCVVKSSVVANQPHLFSFVRFDQRDQKYNEMGAAFTGGDGVNDFARCVVNAAIDDLFFIFSRTGNLWLAADFCPRPSQGRMKMNLRFILKNQSLCSIFSQGLFFNTFNSALDFVNAFSFRLPLSVCLGRWNENFSLCRCRAS